MMMIMVIVGSDNDDNIVEGVGHGYSGDGDNTVVLTVVSRLFFVVYNEFFSIFLRVARILR